MEKIDSIIEKTVKKLQREGPVKRYKVLKIWDVAVGEAIADVAQPYSLRHKTLYVTVRDSVWMRQLTFLEETMKEKINSIAEKQVVEKIVFKIGGLRQREMSRRKNNY